MHIFLGALRAAGYLIPTARGYLPSATVQKSAWRDKEGSGQDPGILGYSAAAFGMRNIAGSDSINYRKKHGVL